LQAHVANDGFDRLLGSFHLLLHSLDGPAELDQLLAQLGQALADRAREGLRPGGGAARFVTVLKGVPQCGQ
jgi:hypothetical protein